MIGRITAAGGGLLYGVTIAGRESLVVAAVVVIAVAMTLCWTINDGKRSERLALLIRA